MMYSTTPADQMSAFLASYSVPPDLTTSGAMYDSVPT